MRGKATYKLGGWLLSGKVGVATGPFPKQYPQSMVQVKSFVSTEEKLLLWSINGEKRSYLPSERTLQRKDPSKKSRNNFARSWRVFHFHMTANHYQEITFLQTKGICFFCSGNENLRVIYFLAVLNLFFSTLTPLNRNQPNLNLRVLNLSDQPVKAQTALPNKPCNLPLSHHLTQKSLKGNPIGPKSQTFHL